MRSHLSVARRVYIVWQIVVASILALTAGTTTVLGAQSLLNPDEIFDMSSSNSYYLKKKFLTAEDDDPDTARNTEPVTILGDGKLGPLDIEYLLVRNGKKTPNAIILYFHGTSVGIDGTYFREHVLKDTGLPILLPGRAGYGNSEFVSLSKLKLETPEKCGDRYHKLILKLQAARVLASKNLKIIAISMSGGGPCAMRFVEKWERKRKHIGYRKYEVAGFIMQASFAHKWYTKTAGSSIRLKSYIRQQLSGILELAVSNEEVKTDLANVKTPQDVRLDHAFSKIKPRLDKIVATNRGLFDNFNLRVIVAVKKLRNSLRALYAADTHSRVRSAKKDLISSVERINSEIAGVKQNDTAFHELDGFVAAALRKDYGLFTIDKQLLAQYAQEISFEEIDKTGRSIQLVSLLGYFNAFLKTIELANQQSAVSDPKGAVPTSRRVGGEVQRPSGSAMDLFSSKRNALQNFLMDRVLDKADQIPSNTFTELANAKVIPFLCDDKKCSRLCLTSPCVAKGLLMQAARASVATAQARHVLLYSLIGKAGLNIDELQFSDEEQAAMLAAVDEKKPFTTSHAQTLDNMFKVCRISNSNSAKCVLLNSANVMFEIGRRAKQSRNSDGREIDGLMFVGGITGGSNILSKRNKRISGVPTLMIHDITDPLVPFEHSAYVISTVLENNSDVSVMCPKVAGHFLWSGRDAIAMHNARKHFITCKLNKTQTACKSLKDIIKRVNSDIASRRGLTDLLHFTPKPRKFRNHKTYADYCKK